MNRLCGVLLILCSCGTQTAVAPVTAPISGLPGTIAAIDQPAIGYESAQPLTVRTSVFSPPLLSVADYVNLLPYDANVSTSALAAFDAVASEQGMTDQWIQSWHVAVDNIMAKESRYCWNVRFAATYASATGAGCVLASPGRGDAAGFGQITNVLRPITCELVAICSLAATIASPHASMAALVAVMRSQGVAPWCYDSVARRLHHVACTNPGLPA